MCVEIIKANSSISFKPDLPFEEQLKGSSEVVIDCDHNCPKVIKFLNEVDKACKYGKRLSFTLRVEGNDLNLFKKTKHLNKELMINDIVSQVVQLHKNTDKTLEEISTMCLRDKDGR